MCISHINFALLVLYTRFAAYILGVRFFTKLHSLLVEKSFINLICDSIDDITSINLAAKGMILCKLKKVDILIAVITLLASFYVANVSILRVQVDKARMFSCF